MNSFFYPRLVRKDIKVYYKSEGEFYATYNCATNYNNIAMECQYRCVYCDAHISECGGEPFSLDHFRPLNIFSNKFNGVLKIHPFNLHLSCQKCNVLKTNDWKGCVDTIDGFTHQSGLGYIDRFLDDINEYIKVDENGMVVCIDNSGPGKYMVRKLLLNRTNRVYIRMRRTVRYKAERVLELLLDKQRELVSSLSKDDLNMCSKQKEEMRKLLDLYERFNRINLMKL